MATTAKKPTTRTKSTAKATKSTSAKAKSTAADAPEKKSKHYQNAVATINDVAADKAAYLVGEDYPYLYLAVAADALNYQLFQYKEVVNPQTKRKMYRWSNMNRYGSSLASAMNIFVEDACRQHPRAAATEQFAIGVDRIITKLESVKLYLRNVAAKHDPKSAKATTK